MWISWPKRPKEWIETGNRNGSPYSCCEEHAFYAKQYKGVYAESVSGGTVLTNNYNHYVMFDEHKDGVWQIF